MFGWPIADQALSSLTNVWVSVVAARSLSADSFGEFGIAMAAFLFGIAITRTWTTEPFGILLAKRGPDARRLDVMGLCAASAGMGALTSIIVVFVDLIAGDGVSDAALVLAIVLPFLFLQDALRLTMLVAGNGRSAAINDGVWLVVTIVGTIIVDIASPATSIAVWAVGGVVGAFLGLWQQKVRRLAGGFAWMRYSRAIGMRLSLETLTTAATGHAFVLFVGVAFGLAGAGAVRGVSVLFGPLAVVFGAISIRAVPIIAEFAGDVNRVERAVWRLSAGFAVLAAVQCVLVLALPENVGSKVLGETWTSAHDLFPQYSLVWIATGLAAGPIVGLKAHVLISRTLITRGLSSAVAITLIVYGLAALDLNGLVWLVAAGSVAAVVIWWLSWLSSSAMRPEKSSIPVVQVRANK
jgi:hypothetical protein